MTKIGRKTKYRSIYAKKIIEFFNVAPTSTVIEKFYSKDGRELTKAVTVVNDLPTIIDFALSIGVVTSTIDNWATAKTAKGKPKYPYFLESYLIAKQMQENMWMKNSLKGLYNPYFAGLVGKNMFGWKDKSEIDNKVTGALVIEQVSYVGTDKK